MPIDVHFKIIVPMYNCALWIHECLDSVLRQSYKNWQLIVVIDPSTDNTLHIVEEYLRRVHDGINCMLMYSNMRKYVPKNHVDAIRQSNPANDDVIVLLDGDDSLFGSDVLEYLASVYADESVWITWGSYVFRHNKTKKGLASIAVPEPKDDPYDGQRWWRFSHLKTFRYFLFKGISDTDLREKETGEYYKVAGDMALMFPMVEMAGREHSKYIDKILYVYNQSTPYNDEKVNRELVKKCDLEIRNRTKYITRTKEELCRLP